MIAEIAQAAAEAVKQGSSSGITLILPTSVISAVSTAIIVKTIDKFSAKRNGNSRGPRPGEGKTCGEHGEAIKGLKASDAEIKTVLSEMNGKLDQLIMTMVGK